MSNLTGRAVIQKPELEELPKVHPRGCDCKRCTGRRNRRKGLERQRVARKTLGITPQFHGQASNEEQWNESKDLPGIRFEVKSGKSLPVYFLNAIAQVEASRPYVGSMFKPAVVLSPSGTSKQYLVIELGDITNLSRSWQEVGKGYAIKNALHRARAALNEIEGLV
jgi:hypothetical protein